MKSIRGVYCLGLVICVGLFAVVAYLQFEKGLAPCPLCDLQRIALALITLCYLFAFVHNPSKKGAWGYALLIVLFATLGGLLAGRQIWLQHQPPGSVTACGFGLEYLLQTLPFFDAMHAAVQGSAQCATVFWRFLGLSIPEWSMVFFIMLGLVSLIQVKRATR